MVQGGPSKDTTPKAFCSGGVDSGKAVAESALATLLSFTAYLRPSEVLGLRGNDVVGPTKAHPHIAKNEWKFQRWDFQMNLPSWTRQSCLAQPHHQKVQSKKGIRLPVQLGLSHLEKRVGECIGQHQSSKKPLHVVPTQRSFSRPTSRATQRLGGQDEEALAGGLFSASVRVPRQTSAVSTVASAGAATRTGSGFKAREAGPKVFTPMKTALFQIWWEVEFCSGCANLSKACAAEGFHILAYDILYGPGNDLLTVLEWAFKFLRTHRIALVWLGAPCTSWSRARKLLPGTINPEWLVFRRCNWCLARTTEALKKTPGSRARLPRLELLAEGAQVMFWEPPPHRRGLARR